jgi:hypothetical protein
MLCFQDEMTSALRKFASIALRLTIATACCLAVWNSWKIARADYLSHKNDEQSLRGAIALAPDSWIYYMQLADFDRQHARELLNKSLALDRFNSLADIELGWEYEAGGDYGRAEKSLLAAYEVDRTYPPRWNLAHYYFRRRNAPAFWLWARTAADMPADDVRPLFELCWRAAPNPETIARVVLGNRPELMNQYTQFLMDKGQLDAASDIARRLVRGGNPGLDRPLLFALVDRLASANRAVPAVALWQALIRQHWVIADQRTPNNGEFLREPLPVSFDWSISQDTGLHSWPGPSGLETEFTGTQPEDCSVAEQIVSLGPGNYSMTYAYRTSDVPPDTGIHWIIMDANSNTVLARSADLSSSALQTSRMSFSVPTGTSLLRLRLAYQRAPGTPRISGNLVVLSSEIKVDPKA